MTQRYGASPEAWDHFAEKLGLVEDLLPVVSNPNAVISDQSKMQALGKTPSIYNRERKVAGLSKWTALTATPFNITRWKSEEDYGICVQTRKVRAFDIDVDNEKLVDAIEQAIYSVLKRHLPKRWRADSFKCLLGFTFNRPLTKHVIPVEGGIVEVLADGQQFIAAGTHPSGARYTWDESTGSDLPALFPVITGEEFARIIEMLETLYATGDTRIARERRAGAGADLNVHDDVADWLVENWEVYDVGSADQLFIECPFTDDHTSDTGPSSTAYFPAGTGGYAQGHFVCLHAHCVGREDVDFRDATGYSVGQFQDLTAVPSDTPHGGDTGSGLGAGSAEAHGRPADALPNASTPSKPSPNDPWPPVIRDAQSRIEPTADNMRRMISHGVMVNRAVAYDSFTDDLMTSKLTEEGWQRLTDADMVDIRAELEQRGTKPMSKDLLRECTYAAGHMNIYDSAQGWLSGLRWDGVERIDTFAVDCWGWKDTPYSRAVGAYTWTALAGRVVHPGVRADMAPILVGVQGIKKTSAIQAMVPNEDFYVEIKLDDRDDDIARKLRGKMIGELEELRGLNSRAIEEIKAFVSRRRENWVPKFKEFATFYLRRCLLVGSTNDNQFLADPTGERRWLPGESHSIDIGRIIDTRDQLWAEAALRFAMDGVEWEPAERLAKAEHGRFKINDSWSNKLDDWLRDEDVAGKTVMSKGYVTVAEALTALGIQLSQANRGHELRVAKVLRDIGLREIDIHTDNRSFKAYER